MTAGTLMRALPRRPERFGAETTLIAARHGLCAQGGGVWIPPAEAETLLGHGLQVTRPRPATVEHDLTK